MNQPAGRRLERAAQVTIVLIGLLVILCTFRDYGASWDESTNLRYGDLILRYLESGFRDHAVDRFINMRYYGPLFDTLVAFCVRLAPASPVDVHHLLIALSGLATLPALFRLARLMGRPLAGVLGAIVLATMPLFYGHAFVNGKDIPFACAFAWAMTALIGLLAGGSGSVEARDGRGPRAELVGLHAALPWGRVVLCGLAFGAAAAVRPGGLAILLFFFVAAVGLAVVTGHWSFVDTRAIRSSAAKLAAILALAWSGMVALWPWAHASPLLRPIGAMKVAASFPAVYPVLFEGRSIPSNALPRRYLLEYVAITTPPVTLALALVGLTIVLRWLIVEPRSSRTRSAVMVAVWLVAPIALWTILTPNIVDGSRHFLFVMPALALMAGVGGAGLMDRLARWQRGPFHGGGVDAQARIDFAAGGAEGTRRPGASRTTSEGERLNVARIGLGALAQPRRRRLIPTAALVAGWIMLGLAIASPVPALVRLHPYQMTYFNSFVGGLRGAADRYETDYWLTSYKEGMEWIQSAGMPSRDAPVENGSVDPGEGESATNREHHGATSPANTDVESGRPLGPPRVLVAANELSRLCAEAYAHTGTTVGTIFDFNPSPVIPPSFDVYLSTTRYGLDKNFPQSPIVHRIGRDGATFAVIRRRSP